MLVIPSKVSSALITIGFCITQYQLVGEISSEKDGNGFTIAANFIMLYVLLNMDVDTISLAALHIGIAAIIKFVFPFLFILRHNLSKESIDQNWQQSTYKKIMMLGFCVNLCLFLVLLAIDNSNFEYYLGQISAILLFLSVSCLLVLIVCQPEKAKFMFSQILSS